MCKTLQLVFFYPKRVIILLKIKYNFINHYFTYTTIKKENKFEKFCSFT